ncbi:MAG: hypothetical protein Q7J34_09275 [Bacteroidales bacterium]|nr:hypothetical protein [Bacteroidales bacterium]
MKLFSLIFSMIFISAIAFGQAETPTTQVKKETKPERVKIKQAAAEVTVPMPEMPKEAVKQQMSDESVPATPVAQPEKPRSPAPPVKIAEAEEAPKAPESDVKSDYNAMKEKAKKEKAESRSEKKKKHDARKAEAKIVKDMPIREVTRAEMIDLHKTIMADRTERLTAFTFTQVQGRQMVSMNSKDGHVTEEIKKAFMALKTGDIFIIENILVTNEKGENIKLDPQRFRMK